MDSGLETEIKRWVFPEICDSLVELGREIEGPFHPLKLCGTGAELMACLPSRWQLEPPTWFMRGGAVMRATTLPKAYRAETTRDGAVVRVRILSDADSLAASGYAAETDEAFVYDRIITAPDHQRQGLGRAVMARLQAAKRDITLAELLVATEQGRALYEALGWSILSPYSTALIPAGQEAVKPDF